EARGECEWTAAEDARGKGCEERRRERARCGGADFRPGDAIRPPESDQDQKKGITGRSEVVGIGSHGIAAGAAELSCGGEISAAVAETKAREAHRRGGPQTERERQEKNGRAERCAKTRNRRSRSFAGHEAHACPSRRARNGSRCAAPGTPKSRSTGSQ